MDVDFSQEAKRFLEAYPQKQPEVLPLEQRVLLALEAKANLHNEKFDRKVTVEQLVSVYNRGQAVTDWVYSASKSVMQWAFARVNNFLYMHEGKTVDKSYKIADRDIADGELEYEAEDEGKGYFKYRELDFAAARIDIKKFGILESEADIKITDLQGLVFNKEA